MDLAERLWEILHATHAPWGEEIEPFPAQFTAYHAVGEGVAAVVTVPYGRYMLVAYPPGGARARCTAATLRLIAAELRSTPLRFMVYYRNFPSIRAVRKLGAKPQGVDEDGYLHYLLTPEDYRYGQKEPTAEAA